MCSKHFFFREVERLLSLINLPSEVIANSYAQKRCNTICLSHFQKGEACQHYFKFCIHCQDIWYSHIHSFCPRHENVKIVSSLNYFPTNTFAPFDTNAFEKREVTATNRYDDFDTMCDDVCEYTFENLKYSECRHDKRKCQNCKLTFERLLMCNCYLNSFTTSITNEI